MATAPDLHEPQIAAARAQAWHQAGDALLTLEAARTWLNEHGLILFTARPALGAPAPSLVEATLGTAQESTSAPKTSLARGLVARLVGEGSAVPLNLLGGPGDLPDFLVAASAFPFIFTLRGDKGWKRPPETAGAVKVSPLALRVYELLAERGALPVAEIASEIGREVNESAASRALSELWQLLRVLPVLQTGEGETRWELTTARFLKAIKAGANAGQPTALSALISLYLHQSLVATEEEIAGFLSPLTARSRVRDVLHGLTAARQLAEGVLNGKTVLFVPDALPDFAQFAAPAPSEADVNSAPPDDVSPQREDSRPRIRRFGGETGGVPKDRNLRGKPVRAGSTRAPSERPRRSFTPDRDEAGPRRPAKEGRPFTPRPPRSEGERAAPGSTRGPRGDRPGFARPWEEERAARPPRREAGEEGARPFRARADVPSRRSRDTREGGAGRSSTDRPAPKRSAREHGDDRSPRPFRPAGPPRGEGRPPFRAPEADSEDRPSYPRRSFGAGGNESRARPREDDRRSAPRGDRPPRPFRPRQGTDEGGPPKRPYRPRADEAQRDTAASERPFRPRPAGGGREAGFRARSGPGASPFRPRAERPRDGGNGPERGAGRPEGASFGRKSGDRPTGRGGSAERGRPADRKGGAPGAFRTRPGAERGGGSSRPRQVADGARPPRPERPKRPKRPEDEA